MDEDEDILAICAAAAVSQLKSLQETTATATASVLAAVNDSSETVGRNQIQTYFENIRMESND
jgi:hypothetical protein